MVTTIEIALGFLITVIAVVYAYGLYEMVTMPRDDPRWNDISETQVEDPFDLF